MDNKETLAKFRERKNKADEIMGRLKKFVSAGDELGIAIPQSLNKKIDRVAAAVGEDKKLKVALIGGFSEGKTTIVSAWLERFDESSMKINQQESSDEVQVYEDEDSGIELIDTPGLFGFKEKYNADEGMVEKYKDITKKYVSEAHLVLYVMDPTNPIKLTHKDELNWLLRELNLLPRTVFVLSRFDEVADVEDDWEYQDALEIKRENVLGRLRDLISLTAEEEEEIEIVGVAANPFGKGMDYWLEHKEQLRELSRIETLQQATSKTIERKGGFFPLVFAAQQSVANDILTSNMELIKTSAEETALALENYRKTIESTKKNLAVINSKGQLAQSALIKFITRYFGNLKAQLNGCGMETFQSFYDAEIGKDGCIMYANIQNEFNTQLQTVEVALEHAALDYEANVKQFDSTMEIMGKKGLDFLRHSGVVNAKNIKFLRDGIKSLALMLGTDLGSVLKFKPWGAAKLANNLGNALQVVGIIMELWDSYKKAEAQEKFNKAVKGMNDDFDKMQQELLELIQGKDFMERVFPEYVRLKTEVANSEEKIEEIEAKKEAMKQWLEEGKKIATACASL